MTFENITPPAAISSFVKNIVIIEDESPIDERTVLPFYADGYPGLMFQDAENGLLVNPHLKQMPSLFLYGQTVAPVELVMQGSYRLIGYQLYPFVIKSFFNVNPVDLNDACYDLTNFNSDDIVRRLNTEQHTNRRVTAINSFLQELFELKRSRLDFNVKSAIQLIIDHNGRLTIKEVCDKLRIAERTLERNFLNESGITPKQFSRMMQFQCSLARLDGNDYIRLSDVVYTNGFADQSHFIRVFKSFTGKTPRQYAVEKA